MMRMTGGTKKVAMIVAKTTASRGSPFARGVRREGGGRHDQRESPSGDHAVGEPAKHRGPSTPRIARRPGRRRSRDPVGGDTSRLRPGLEAGDQHEQQRAEAITRKRAAHEPGAPAVPRPPRAGRARSAPAGAARSAGGTWWRPSCVLLAEQAEDDHAQHHEEQRQDVAHRRGVAHLVLRRPVSAIW